MLKFCTNFFYHNSYVSCVSSKCVCYNQERHKIEIKIKSLYTKKMESMIQANWLYKQELKIFSTTTYFSYSISDTQLTHFIEGSFSKKRKKRKKHNNFRCARLECIIRGIRSIIHLTNSLGYVSCYRWLLL